MGDEKMKDLEEVMSSIRMVKGIKESEKKMMMEKKS